MERHTSYKEKEISVTAEEERKDVIEQILSYVNNTFGYEADLMNSLIMSESNPRRDLFLSFLINDWSTSSGETFNFEDVLLTLSQNKKTGSKKFSMDYARVQMGELLNGFKKYQIKSQGSFSKIENSDLKMALLAAGYVNGVKLYPFGLGMPRFRNKNKNSVFSDRPFNLRPAIDSISNDRVPKVEGTLEKASLWAYLVNGAFSRKYRNDVEKPKIYFYTDGNEIKGGIELKEKYGPLAMDVLNPFEKLVLNLPESFKRLNHTSIFSHILADYAKRKLNLANCSKDLSKKEYEDIGDIGSKKEREELYIQAISFAEMARWVSSDNPNVYDIKGDAYLALGNSEKAKEEYKRGIKKHSGAWPLYMKLASMLCQIDNEDSQKEAQKYYKIVMTRCQENKSLKQKATQMYEHFQRKQSRLRDYSFASVRQRAIKTKSLLGRLSQK